jgi:hypothetical protein
MSKKSLANGQKRAKDGTKTTFNALLRANQKVALARSGLLRWKV